MSEQLLEALTVVALEVILAASVAVCGGDSSCDHRSGMISSWTRQFVRSITAIVLAVTLPPKRNAILVATLKHRGAAVTLSFNQMKKKKKHQRHIQYHSISSRLTKLICRDK